MSENFFLDNPDLQFRLQQLDLREVLELKEKGYAESEIYPTAPRNYADAIDNYRIVLDVLGEVCGERVAPRAAEADEEGAHYDSGEVTYAAATQDAIDALRQAELFGAMLSREYGGLNLPESVYQMMVEMVARAESGLMTVYGLQEIASSIEEHGDPETKARVLPRFARGEVSGAMVLTEADAGSDLGAVAPGRRWTRATGQWHLNGVKRHHQRPADVSLVLARSEEGSSDARGLSMFLVERDDTVKIRRIENKMGIHASPTCEIQYVNTPATLLGKRRFGLMRYAMNLMNGARLAVAAQASASLRPPTGRRTSTPGRASSSASQSGACQPWAGCCSRCGSTWKPRGPSWPRRDAGWTCGRSTRRPSRRAARRRTRRCGPATSRPRPWPRP
jgi:alkylation response protein AidB-like acyl-CoA dehydrogenase